MGPPCALLWRSAQGSRPTNSGNTGDRKIHMNKQQISLALRVKARQFANWADKNPFDLGLYVGGAAGIIGCTVTAYLCAKSIDEYMTAYHNVVCAAGQFLKDNHAEAHEKLIEYLETL